MCNDQIADSPFLDNSITVHSPECFSFLELRITRNIPLYAGSTYLYSLIIVSGSAQNCSCHEDTGSWIKIFDVSAGVFGDVNQSNEFGATMRRLLKSICNGDVATRSSGSPESPLQNNIWMDYQVLVVILSLSRETTKAVFWLCICGWFYQ